MEREKSLLEKYLSFSSPLRQLKIQPGRKDHQVQKRDVKPGSCTRDNNGQNNIFSCFFFFFTQGKSTLSLVSLANYKWFEEWKDGKVSKRGPGYEELKQAFIDSILEVVMDVFPKITRDKVTFLNRFIAKSGLY